MLHWLVLIGGTALSVWAQNAPDIITVPVPAAAPAPGAATAPAPTYPLRQILIADSLEASEKLAPVPGGDFVVVSDKLAFLRKEEFSKLLIEARGQIISDQLLGAIVRVIGNYARQRDYPAADVSIPTQDISAGVVRFAVLLGKYRDIKVVGNRWFSEALLREKLGVDRGGTFRLSELDQAVNWANTNPFRLIKVAINPVQEGEADVIIGVQERLPLRLAVSYDNTGNEVLGKDHYSTSLTYGNLWGRDHQITYQHTRTREPGLFQAHALEYRVPLRWRHMLTVSSNYLKVQPTFFGGYFTQVGENASANVRYVAPFGLRDWRCEVSGEADFKQTNNNLAFGGTSVLATKTDLFAVTLGAVGLRDDARGRWAVSCSVTGSPGNVNSRNGDDAYQMSREGSRARYLRGQIRLQRAQRLTPTMTTSVQVVTQFASANLLASEQLSVGGAMSVRGYHERVFAGDEGVLLTHEVEHQLLNRAVAKRLPPLGVSAVYFWDFGRVFIKHPLLLEPPAHSISSAGVGLRVGMGANFSASIDYGRQLIDSQMPGAGRGRLHTRLTLAF